MPYFYQHIQRLQEVLRGDCKRYSAVDIPSFVKHKESTWLLICCGRRNASGLQNSINLFCFNGFVLIYPHSDLLNKLYEEAKESEKESAQVVLELNEKLKNSEQMKIALSKQFDNIKSWSDMYDKCEIESKKMILSHIMKAVRIRRDYEIEIDLTVDIQQLGFLSDEAASTNTSVYSE